VGLIPEDDAPLPQDQPGERREITAAADVQTPAPQEAVPIAQTPATRPKTGASAEGTTMAYAGQTLENPITDERIIFHKTAADTDGELLAIDLILAPDGHVPGAHVHPSQEERFEVISGTMKFRLGRKKIIANAGDVVVVPPGAVHKFANAGDETARVRVEVRPALKMEQLFETTVALAHEGRTNGKGMPKPLDLALFVHEDEDEVHAPFPPAPVVKAAMAPLVWIAKHRGLAERYIGPRLRPAPAV
jgi:quercetin dioxygenase-like cupin family protein